MLFRHLTKRQLADIVRRHKPRGYRIRHTKRMTKLMNGYASYRRKVLVVPQLINVEGLYVYLHECGHVHMCHFHKKVRPIPHREEYEAELYAINALRAERVFFPLRLRQAARAYIARHVRQDRKAKHDICQHVVLWSRS